MPPARAGLPVLRLLNEPTAAAVAYGLDRAENGTYVVYDSGRRAPSTCRCCACRAACSR